MKRPSSCIVLAILLCASTAVAQVYQPPNAFNFSTWTGANESWFQYPETLTGSNYSIPVIQSKPQLGIALSGGGFRAATLGLGYLRALHLLHITSSAKYLTSNSGGSWLAATFSFQQQVDLDTFFGPYIPPQQLSLSAIQQANSTAGSFAGVIANAGILIPGAVGRYKQMQRCKQYSAVTTGDLCSMKPIPASGSLGPAVGPIAYTSSGGSA